MLIKEKSILVVILSSIVILLVLVFTLIGYYMYIELKAREEEKVTSDSLKKIESKIFSKYVEVSGISCAIESSGAMKGRVVLKGVMRNKGRRDLSNIVLKVKFIDERGASIYEVILHPLEPAFGIDQIGHITKAYLLGVKKNLLKSNSSVAFSRIISNCPRGLVDSLKPSRKGRKAQSAKRISAWSGKLIAETLSVSL